MGSVRWNAAFAFLEDVRGQPNLTILGHTLADRLTLTGETATTLLCQVMGKISTIMPVCECATNRAPRAVRRLTMMLGVGDSPKVRSFCGREKKTAKRRTNSTSCLIWLWTDQASGSTKSWP